MLWNMFLSLSTEVHAYLSYIIQRIYCYDINTNNNDTISAVRLTLTYLQENLASFLQFHKILHNQNNWEQIPWNLKLTIKVWIFHLWKALMCFQTWHICSKSCLTRIAAIFTVKSRKQLEPQIFCALQSKALIQLYSPLQRNIIINNRYIG